MHTHAQLHSGVSRGWTEYISTLSYTFSSFYSGILNLQYYWLLLDCTSLSSGVIPVTPDWAWLSLYVLDDRCTLWWCSASDQMGYGIVWNHSGCCRWICHHVIFWPYFHDPTSRGQSLQHLPSSSASTLRHGCYSLRWMDRTSLSHHLICHRGES